MANPPDHPTSLLPADPRRVKLERLQQEIITAMNEPGCNRMFQLQSWVNRITEVIHFNGSVPAAITGIDDPATGLDDLDDGMRFLTYIAKADSTAMAATQAKLAFDKVHSFRHHLHDRITKIISHLDSAKSAWNVFDEGSARSAVKCARDIAADFLGLR